MEIKLNLRLETFLAMITFLENMDMETCALIAVAVMMIPFIIYSLWSLTFALMCQLFWLGVKAGVVLLTVCSATMGLLRFSNWRPVAGARAFGVGVTSAAASGEGIKCTFLDIVFTVLFQAGIRVPSGIWNGLMDNFVKNSGEGDGVDGLSKITRKKKERKTLRDNVKSVGSSSTGAQTGASEDDMSAEDNLDITEEVFEDVGASGDFVSPRSPEEAIIKGILLDEEMPSGVTILASGENGTRRKTRGGRKRTKTNNN